MIQFIVIAIMTVTIVYVVSKSATDDANSEG